MDIDKFIVTATLILFDVFLACFTALVLMIIVDGIRDWRKSVKKLFADEMRGRYKPVPYGKGDEKSKIIKPTVPRDKEHG